MAYLKTHFIAAHTALKQISRPTILNTAHHKVNQMAAELNIHFESTIDEVINGVHALGKGQAEAPPVEAVKE